MDADFIKDYDKWTPKIPHGFLALCSGACDAGSRIFLYRNLFTSVLLSRLFGRDIYEVNKKSTDKSDGDTRSWEINNY